MIEEMSTKRVAVVVFPQFQALDAVGPVEVFSTANWLAEGPGTRYQVELVSADAGPVRSDSGIRFEVDRTLRSRALQPDVLVIAGGVGAEAAAEDRSFINRVRSLARQTDQVAAICTGAIILAQTGLLDGRAATTHWSAAADFSHRFPAVRLEADRIFVHDDGVWTSAGVTAGIDLAMELVRRDYGEAVAAEVARHLVVYLQRSGGQTQYSSHLAAQHAGHPTIRDVQTSIVQAPADDHSLAALASRAMMSERPFQRVFKQQTGTTPGRYVEQVRIDQARRLLESTTHSLSTIGRSSGFGTLETFLRAFHRQLGITPSQYRGRFNSAEPSANTSRSSSAHR